jgi:hypothetical protein
MMGSLDRSVRNERLFGAFLCQKIHLPRQARDKHGEHVDQKHVSVSAGSSLPYHGQQHGCGCMNTNATGEKTALLSAFYTTMHHFIKAGSGQT